MGSALEFDKGDNALVKLQNLEMDTNEYEGDIYRSLDLTFKAVKENDHSVEGTLPFWPSSKVTIADTEEMSSALGKMLVQSEEAENILAELVGNDEIANAIANGDKRWEAETDEENEALGKAVAQFLSEKVFRVGVKIKEGKNGDYPVIKEFYKTVDEDPFDEPDSDDADSEDEVDEDDSGQEDGDDALFGEDDEEKPGDEDEGDEFV